MGQKFHFTLLECSAYPVRRYSNGVKKHGDAIQRDSNGVYGAKRIFFRALSKNHLPKNKEISPVLPALAAPTIKKLGSMRKSPLKP